MGRPHGEVALVAYFDPTPLLDHARLLLGDGDASVAEIAVLLAVAPRTVFRWQAGRSRVAAHVADVCAVRLGFHPFELWPGFDDPEDACLRTA